MVAQLHLSLTCVIFEMKISFGSSPVVSNTSNSSPKSQNRREHMPYTSALMNYKTAKIVSISETAYAKGMNSHNQLCPKLAEGTSALKIWWKSVTNTRVIDYTAQYWRQTWNTSLAFQNLCKKKQESQQ